jgi:hypothetical protein
MGSRLYSNGLAEQLRLVSELSVATQHALRTLSDKITWRQWQAEQTDTRRSKVWLLASVVGLDISAFTKYIVQGFIWPVYWYYADNDTPWAPEIHKCYYTSPSLNAILTSVSLMQFVSLEPISCNIHLTTVLSYPSVCSRQSLPTWFSNQNFGPSVAYMLLALPISSFLTRWRRS